MITSLASQSVSRVSFDFAISLLTDMGTEVRIQTPFTLIVESGSLELDPQSRSAEISNMLRLLDSKVVDSSIEESGLLTLEFDSGIGIRIEPHGDFEAWTIAGADGSKVVCLPGGGLTTWEAAR